MWIICAGMMRSGSTWQYMVTSHIVEECMHGRRCGFAGLHLIQEAERKAIDQNPRVFKIHGKDSALGILADTGAAAVIYCYRDIRDVAVSTMTKMSLSFDRLIEFRVLQWIIEGDVFWRARSNTLVQRYEEMVAEPTRSIREIAYFLDIEAPDKYVDDLADRYSLDKNKARCQTLAASLTRCGVDLRDCGKAARFRDTFSELHWNHIYSGRTERWRTELSTEQQNVLNDMFGDWLRANSYL